MRDFVFPHVPRQRRATRANQSARTSIAPCPLISQASHVVFRRRDRCRCHRASGATGQGAKRSAWHFELSAYGSTPTSRYCALARLGIKSRTDLIEFAERHQIQVAKDKKGEAPFSVDANLLHSSSEGKVLEDPWVESAGICPNALPSRRWTRPTSRPMIPFRSKGSATPVGHQWPRYDAGLAAGCAQRNSAMTNGIGRLDLVENRFSA